MGLSNFESLFIFFLLSHHSYIMLTTKGGGSQPTPLQRRGPLAPYPVTGWIGDTLWWENKHGHLECRATWKLAHLLPEPDSNQMVLVGGGGEELVPTDSYQTHEIPFETFYPGMTAHSLFRCPHPSGFSLTLAFFLLEQKIRLSTNWFT